MSHVKNHPGSNNKHTKGRPTDPCDRQYNGYTGKGCIDSDSDYTSSDLEDFIEDDSYSSEDEDYFPEEVEEEDYVDSDYSPKEEDDSAMSDEEER